jgi:hypothetical protein
MARKGLYCEKHARQYHDDLMKATEQPEKWFYREEKINGKVYRDYVYRP